MCFNMKHITQANADDAVNNSGNQHNRTNDRTQESCGSEARSRLLGSTLLSVVVRCCPLCPLCPLWVPLPVFSHFTRLPFVPSPPSIFFMEGAQTKCCAVPRQWRCRVYFPNSLIFYHTNFVIVFHTN